MRLQRQARGRGELGLHSVVSGSPTGALTGAWSNLHFRWSAQPILPQRQRSEWTFTKVVRNEVGTGVRRPPAQIPHKYLPVPGSEHGAFLLPLRESLVRATPRCLLVRSARGCWKAGISGEGAEGLVSL